VGKAEGADGKTTKERPESIRQHTTSSERSVSDATPEYDSDQSAGESSWLLL
jgi:hypothetical protein